MSEHIPEPWHVVDTEPTHYEIWSCGVKICSTICKCISCEVSARRIVAAINACQGISTKQLEDVHASDVMQLGILNAPWKGKP